VQLSTTVPNYVIDTGKRLGGYLWDTSCPFGSLYVWMMVLSGLYYLTSLPDNYVYLDKDGQTIRVEKVTRTLRWWLVSSAVIMTGVGYFLIRRGCTNAGSLWAGLWFIAALFLAKVVSAFIMASVETVVACKVPK